MKQKYKIILIILLALFVINIIVMAITNENQPEISIVGNNSNGTVYKTICGNLSSNDTVAVILGVHNLESGIHNATNETLMNITNNTENNNLSKKYVVYFITLNENQTEYNTSEYTTNRHMGEMLGNEFVVPDIAQYNPFVVIDVHEMEDYWYPQEFIEVISTNSSVAESYGARISNDTNVMLYNFTSGTSPEYVTVPVAKQGLDTILFETAQADSYDDKKATALKLIHSLDNLTVKH